MSFEKMIEDIVRRVVREELELAAAKRAVAEITIAEYAATRSISITTVRDAIRDGRLPAKKYGHAVRVPADAEIGARLGTKKAEEPPAVRAAGILDRVRGVRR